MLLSLDVLNPGLADRFLMGGFVTMLIAVIVAWATIRRHSRKPTEAGGDGTE